MMIMKVNEELTKNKKDKSKVRMTRSYQLVGHLETSETTTKRFRRNSTIKWILSSKDSNSGENSPCLKIVFRDMDSWLVKPYLPLRFTKK